MVDFALRTLKPSETTNVFHKLWGQTVNGKKFPGLIGMGGKPLPGIVREKKGIYKGLSEKQWHLVQMEFHLNPRWRDEYGRYIVLIERLFEPQRRVVRLPKSPREFVKEELRRIL